MRWAPGDRGNIEDARGSSGMRVGSIGIGGFLVLLILSWATGTDFLSLLGGGGGTSPDSVGRAYAPLPLRNARGTGHATMGAAYFSQVGASAPSQAQLPAAWTRQVCF